MAYKNRFTNKFWGLVLILCLTRATHGKLMCYVCDDCAQVTAQTPQFECNEDFFNTSGPTDSSVQTTTELSKTTTAITETTTTTTGEPTPAASTMSSEETTVRSTTEANSSESTNKESTGNATETATEIITEATPSNTTETTTQRSTSSTNQQQSTPAATGSPKTTTTMSVPLYTVTDEALDDVDNLNNRTTAQAEDANKDEVETIDITNATTKLYKPSAEIRSRQQRSVSDVTYHCFKVEATTVNGTMVVNRGCSRTQARESVCSQWEAQHTNEKMKKCYKCSSTKCNGGSALSVSLTALIVAVVAIFMHRK